MPLSSATKSKAMPWGLMALCATALLVSACKAPSFMGGGSEDAALVVTPGDSLDARPGPTLFGIGNIVTSSKVTNFDGTEPLPGRWLPKGSGMHFKYSKLGGRDVMHVVHMNLSSGVGEGTTLRSFARNTTEPVIVDLVTDLTVKFFKDVIKRAPYDLEEIDRVEFILRNADTQNCLSGINMPSSLRALRAYNNSIASSPAVAQLESLYGLNLVQKASLTQDNKAPKVIAGIPFPAASGVTTIRVRENSRTTIQVNVLDSDNDIVVGRWSIDGVPVHNDPTYPQIFSFDNSIPKEFHLPQSLELFIDYSFLKKGETGTRTVSLTLCDGGAPVVYDYIFDVNDTNRAPRFLTQIPEFLEAEVGQELSFELTASDLDGDKLYFETAQSVRENVFISSSLTNTFTNIKIPQGAFFTAASARSYANQGINPRFGDNWFEQIRGPNALQITPRYIEFIPSTSKVRIVGMHQTDPNVVQEKDISFDYAPNPFTNGQDGLRFRIESVDLEFPRPLTNVTLYCVLREQGYRTSYEGIITCDHEAYPRNFDIDGIMAFRMACPTNDQLPELGATPLFNPRCRASEGTYTQAPDTGETSVAKSKLVFRLEQYQGSTPEFTLPIYVIDDRGASAQVLVVVKVTKKNQVVPVQWSSIQVPEHYQRTAAGTHFNRVHSVNAGPYLLKAPMQRDPDFSTRHNSEPFGSLIRYTQRGARQLTKAHWWLETKWDKVETLGAPIPVFDSTPHIMFLENPTNTYQHSKLLVSRADLADPPATILTKSFRFPLTAAGTNLAGARDADIFAYELLSAEETNFVVRLRHARGYGLHQYCKGIFDESLLNMSWTLQCADTQADVQSAAPSYRFSVGAEALVNHTTYPMHPGTPAEYISSDEKSKEMWTYQDCRIGKDVPLVALQGAPCSRDPASANIPGIMTLLDVWGESNHTTVAGLVPTLSNYTDPSLADPMLSLPVSITSGNTGIALTATMEVFPRSQRIRFFGAALDGVTHRWCRYALRDRLTRLVLTCSNQSGSYPALYEYANDASLVTLEYAAGTKFEALSGFPRYGAYRGSVHFTSDPNVQFTVSAAPAPEEVTAVQNALDPSRPFVNGEPQRLRLEGVKSALMGFKVAYDETPWLSVARPENRPARPVFKGFKILRSCLGAGCTTGSVDVTDENRLTIFLPNAAGTATESWSSSLNGRLPKNWVGVPELKQNEIFVAWRPDIPEEYEIELELQDGNNPSIVRTLGVQADIENYVYPPELSIVEGPSGTPYPGVFDPASTNRSTRLLAGQLNQKSIGSMFLTMPGRIETYNVPQKAISPLLVKFKVNAELDTISGFWLVEGNNAPLVDPLAPRDDGRDWHEVWPFRTSTVAGQWQNGDVIDDNVLEILTRRKDTNGDLVVSLGQIDSLQPAKTANLLGSNFQFGISSNPSLTSAGAPGKGLFWMDTDPVTKPLQSLLKITLNGNDFNVVFPGTDTPNNSPQGALGKDFVIEDIDLSNFTAGTSDMLCRPLVISPSGGMKAQTLRSSVKIFCLDAAMDPDDILALESIRHDDLLDRAGMVVGFTGEVLQTPLVYNTSHSLISEAINIGGTTPDDGFEIDVGRVSWGRGLNGLFKAETGSRVRAVLVITDSKNVIMQPFEFRSIAAEDPVAVNRIAAGGLPYCGTAASINQPLAPVNAPIFECLLDDLDIPGLPGSYFWSLDKVSSTGGTDVSGAFSSPIDRHGVEGHAKLVQGFDIDPLIWDAYPADAQFKPVLERIYLGDRYRWKFSWRIPGVARESLRNRSVTLAFNPVADLSRRIFSSIDSVLHYTATPYNSLSPGPYDVPTTGQRATYARRDPTSVDTWLVKIPFSIQEPNRQPCILASGTADPAIGADCPTDLTAGINSPGNRTLTGYVTPTPANGADTSTPYEATIEYENIQKNGNWTAAKEGVAIELPLKAFDQNLSSGSLQRLSDWYVASGPSSAAVATDPIQVASPHVRTGTLYYTPKDSDILKSGPNGDWITMRVGISDQGTGSANSVDTFIRFLVRTWDINNAPGVTPQTGLTYNGGNTLRSFYIDSKDIDLGDGVRWEFMGSTVPQLDAHVEWVSTTRLTAGKSDYRMNFRLRDIPELVASPTIDLFFRVTDVPWWKNNTGPFLDARSSYGAQYYQNHPSFSAGDNRNVDLDEHSRVVTVELSLTATPYIISSGATRSVVTYLAQDYLEPIVVFNPFDLPVTCTVNKQQTLQIPNPAWEPGMPAGQQYIAATDIATVVTVDPAAVGDRYRYVLPKRTVCAVAWRPSSQGWVGTNATNRQFKVNVNVGTTTIVETFNFTTYPQVFPGDDVTRPRLANAAMDAYLNGSNVIATAQATDPDGTPWYSIGEGEKIGFRTSGINKVIGSLSYIWYVNGVPRNAGSNTSGNTGDRHDFVTNTLSSGVNIIDLYIRDASILVPPTSAPPVSEVGYRVLRAKVFVRNNYPLFSAVAHPGNAAKKLHFLGIETSATTASYEPFSLGQYGGSWIGGVANRMILKPAVDFPERYPFVMNFDAAVTGAADGRLKVGTKDFFPTELSVIKHAGSLSTGELSVAAGDLPSGDLAQRRRIFSLSSSSFLVNVLAERRSIMEAQPSPQLVHKLFETTTVTDSGSGYTFRISLNNSASASMNLVRSDDGVAATIPDWVADYTSYRAIQSIGSANDSLLMLAADPSLSATSPMLLVKQAMNDAPQVISVDGLWNGTDPATLVGGKFWTAPCRKTGCGPEKVEVAFVANTATTSVVRWGVLNTDDGSVEDAQSISLPRAIFPVFSGQTPDKHMGYLFPRFAVDSTTGALRPDNHVLMMAVPSSDQIYVVDFQNNIVREAVSSGSDISSLTCSPHQFLCYVGDRAQEGVWRLK